MNTLSTKKIIGLITMLLITFNFSIQAQNGPVSKFGRLQVTGNKVTAEDGSKISLAGMSMFWSGFQSAGGKFYDSRVVDHLATDWNAQIIRAAMAVEEADAGLGYIANPSGAKAKVEVIVDAAIANDIYAIIDFHTHNAENYQSQAITFFKEMATKYGTRDHIIYEIFNEPIGDYEDAARKDLWDNTIKPYAEAVIAEIRKIDPDNLIVVGTPYYDQGVDIASNNQISDNNVAYALHFYAGARFDGRENTDHTTGGRAKARTAMNNGAALFVTEWGTVDSDGNGAVAVQQTNDWITFMRDEGISYANWSVSDKNEGASIIAAGQGINGLLNNNLTTSGNLVKGIIEQQNTLSTPDFKLDGEQINIYPVPATDFITIQTKESVDAISITDLTGKLIFSKVINKVNPTISLDAIATGNYIIKIESKGKTASTLITVAN